MENVETTANPDAERPSASARPQNIGPRPTKAWMKPPPARSVSNKIGWLLVVCSTVLVVGLTLVIMFMASAGNDTARPALDKEFKDTPDNFAIRPPQNWYLQDRVPNTSIIMKGPREKGYPPLIIVSLDIAPGKLTGYVEQHKARISHHDKTVKFISEERDQGIDGCDAIRLEYESEQPVEGEPENMVKIRTLQYILEDPPTRFYRVTCHVAADVFDKYVARFEASARTFKRLPVVVAPPRILRD